jgi:hypothetical protein
MERTHPLKKIAAICTSFYLRSHADNFVTRLLEGYWIDQEYYRPPCEVASLYVDQTHRADVSRKLSLAYDIPIFSSVREAVTLGSDRLSVDGVLLIAEHGDYPLNEQHQKLYPRYEMMEEVVEVFRQSGRVVPVFVDKHLSYDRAKAQRMYQWSRDLEFPLMAGSSLPVTFRHPELDLPSGREIEEILVVGGGWFGESWLLHLLEILQVVAERRAGGETGIKSIQVVTNVGVWRAAIEGRWDRRLLDAALARRMNEGVAGSPEEVSTRCVGCLIEYRDGLKATLLALGGGLVFDYMTAFRLRQDGEVLATAFEIPAENADNMSPLVHLTARMLETGLAQTPIERTLLTTGALSYVMESVSRGQRRLETPDLDVRYEAPADPYFARRRGRPA